ncbi:MAG: hypothetical protein LBU13_11110 [Synergistaceae bacterium]|jgi:hypothetical protein|nr:hypothetical protein [Synergistaceae bacterium]
MLRRFLAGFLSLIKLIMTTFVVLGLALSAVQAGVADLTGAGTAASPYLVSSGNELDEALNKIAEDFEAVDGLNISAMHYIELTKDIDAIASSTYGDEDNDHPVRLTVDGKGYSIKGTLPASAPIHTTGNKYTGFRFANRTPWTETDPGTGRGNHIVLKNLTVSGLHNAEPHGGGAFAMFGGKFEADNCVFSGNASYAAGRDGGEPSRGGGAILLQHPASFLSVKNSAFIKNTAAGAGGAIDSSGEAEDSVIIENSTFYGNKSTAAGGGGGAIVYSRALGSITNCTIVGNESSGMGGGVYARYNLGGRVIGTASKLTLNNSIVAGNNSSTESDAATDNVLVVSADIRGSHNLIGTTSGNVSLGDTLTGVTVSHFLASGPPVVNDSGTPTIALLSVADSPAVDKANEDVAPKTDQRGFTRYGDPDIGAYELLSDIAVD